MKCPAGLSPRAVLADGDLFRHSVQATESKPEPSLCASQALDNALQWSCSQGQHRMQFVSLSCPVTHAQLLCAQVWGTAAVPPSSSFCRALMSLGVPLLPWADRIHFACELTGENNIPLTQHFPRGLGFFFYLHSQSIFFLTKSPLSVSSTMLMVEAGGVTSLSHHIKRQFQILTAVGVKLRTV